MTLIGRAEELHALRTLITRARNGVSGALIVRGEPGIGKTALLEAATSELSGTKVIRSDGYEAELSMPFAALQRVGTSLTDQLDALPARQQQALRVAWGTADGPAPDRFLVGLGMLGLFAAASSVRPIVCVVDDAHWLDSESREVLAFVARRLQAESTVLLFAARDDVEAETQLAGITELRLAGLDTPAAVALLSAAASDVDPFTATQIAAATGGNPLALIDLARDLSIRQLSRLSVSLDPVPISNHLEAHYLRQVRELPPDAQTWLLLAAAEPSGHHTLVANAAAALGLSADCAFDAEHANLVSVGDVIAFRHPLVRSAIYGATHGAERRQAHAALANQAGRLGLVDEEAWHAAASTPGTDSAVADRLEAVAQRAARRGGLVSQARLLTRAAELTPPGPKRNDRLLFAAGAAAEAGAAQLSSDLLDRIDATDLAPVQRGRMIVTRTELAIFIADPGPIVRSPADLLAAADEFHGHEPELEQIALLRAFELAFVTDVLMQGTTIDELGRRVKAGADVLGGPRATVMQGLAAHALLPYAEGVPVMRAALAALETLDDGAITTFGYVGIILATALFDKLAGVTYLERLGGIAREAGALRTLDTVLWVRALFELDTGDPAACGAFVKQVRELRQAIGYAAENVVNVAHLAWTGTPRDQLELIADAVRTTGFGGVYTSAISAMAIVDLADGRYLDAYKRLKPTMDAPLLQVTYIRLADYVEASARSGQLDDAQRTARQLTTMAEASPTPALRGLDHRCRALLASDADAEAHYAQAIDQLAAADRPADLGRAHLLYGEWLRRRKRRRDARSQLHTAVGIFDRIGAPAFAKRARNELAATGEKVSELHVVAGVEMSPREAAVAQLAAAGHTNAEIGATLFISANTVDYHLRKVFGKLGVSSRRQLAERFDG
ncbi:MULTISPECIES: helix-turn-helix transcriptional regulator [unclassified Mycobacterium]|uniref:helix-turn-helix transcriptional regulator n=1 Tax=unclassified Mycobacterium TaxID=2642494 RepID=UPI0029C8AE71|nr:MULTISPECIES: AAA family ATPase [unclassified Mycobacterium]